MFGYILFLNLLKSKFLDKGKTIVSRQDFLSLGKSRGFYYTHLSTAQNDNIVTWVCLGGYKIQADKLKKKLESLSANAALTCDRKKDIERGLRANTNPINFSKVIHRNLLVSILARAFSGTGIESTPYRIKLCIENGLISRLKHGYYILNLASEDPNDLEAALTRVAQQIQTSMAIISKLEAEIATERVRLSQLRDQYKSIRTKLDNKLLGED